MKLIVAEKPSVAMTIADVVGAKDKHEGYVEGNGYRVSWCYGHLLTNANPDVYNPAWKKWSLATLPLVPDKWIDVPITNSGAEEQLDILCSLMNAKDTISLIEATDAGREGELIFRRAYEYSGSKKPFQRLWISSLEASAIREGMKNLKPGSDYDNLYQAALARNRADWLFGINGSRFYTLRDCVGDEKATVGRVQTPTLAMIVGRDREIENFKVTKRFAVVADFNGWKAETDKMEDKSKATECLSAVSGKPYVVQDVETAKKTLAAPRLFSLTALQREMNARYGLSAARTLELLQSLYERKIVSYPRTDAEYITSDMEETYKKIVTALMQSDNIKPNVPMNVHKVVNNAKVSDHYALIITYEFAYRDETPSLSADDLKILRTIQRRMLEAICPSKTYNATKVTLDCNGYEFTSNGNETIDPGWTQIGKLLSAKLGEKDPNAEEESKGNKLPGDIAKGKEYRTDKVTIESRDTKPPKAFTEATLLAAMEKAGAKEMDDEVERKGLGTSATRAGIIETLLKRGYIERSGKNLVSTDSGKRLIDSVGENFKSVDTTVEWENRLLSIEKGKGDENCESFLLSIEDYIRKILKENDGKENPARERANRASESVGKCPWCSGEMNYVGSSTICSACHKKIYSHTLWMPENHSFRAPDVRTLLAGGNVRTTLWSKKLGKSYKVLVSLDKEKMAQSDYAEWNIQYLTDDKKSSSSYKKNSYNNKKKS